MNIICRNTGHEPWYHWRLLAYRWRTSHSMRARIRAMAWFLTGYYMDDCQRCGRKVDLVWTAPDALWRAVIGSTGGVFCPRCFDRLAALRGIGYLRWTPVLDTPESAAP